MAKSTSKRSAEQQGRPGLWTMSRRDWVELPEASADRLAAVRGAVRSAEPAPEVAARLLPFRTKLSDQTLRETIR